MLPYAEKVKERKRNRKLKRDRPRLLSHLPYDERKDFSGCRRGGRGIQFLSYCQKCLEFLKNPKTWRSEVSSSWDKANLL